jgi:hypothetical protein
MEYFILSRKKERGCPTGLLNSILYDRFYDRKEASKIKYGYFPWYADALKYNVHIALPKGLVLISKDPLYDFEIRNHMGSIYYVSENFLNLLNAFNVGFSNCVPISVCNQDGKPISDKQYFAIIFNKFRITDVANLELSVLEIDNFDIIRRIKKLAIRDDFAQHFFIFAKARSYYDTPLCSNDFYRAALEIDVKGINFIPLNNIKWGMVNVV